MIEIKDIDNRDALEAWLRDKPKEWSVAIAARAAMRVLPVWWAWTLESDEARERDLTALPVLRSLVISSVAAKMPTEDMRAEATAAATAAVATDAAVATRAAATAATDAATAVATRAAAATAAAAAAVATDAPAAWRALRVDSRALEAGGDVMRAPLWGEAPNPLHEEWVSIKAKAGVDWAFWTAWYDAELHGEPLHDVLLLDIAKIAPKDWDKGPEYVNSIIEKMWRAFPDRGRGNSSVESAAAKSTLSKEQISALEAQLQNANGKLDRVKNEVSSAERSLAAAQRKVAELEEAANATKLRTEEWMADLQKQFDAKIEAATEALEQKAVFQKPVELWDTKATEHETRKKSAYNWFVSSLIALGFSVVVGFAAVVTNTEKLFRLSKLPGCDDTNPDLDCSAGGLIEFLPLFVVLTLVTLALWFTRLKMKEFLSERHLELDARERRAFAEAYIGLVAAGDSGEEVNDQRAIVYAALFRPSSDGMVKDEGGLDPSIGAAISKLLSR